MNISIFDIFKIGIGPSSSHTVGPMRASKFFCEKLIKHGIFEKTERVTIELYGSLASTGIGHRTDKAVLLGLEGHVPESIDPEKIDGFVDKIIKSKKISLLGKHQIPFDYDKDLIFKPDETLPYHPNGMLYTAFDKEGKKIFIKTFYSIGGGFIVGEKTAKANRLIKPDIQVRFPFKTAAEMLKNNRETGLNLSKIVLENERAWRSNEEIITDLSKIWKAMQNSVKNGLKKSGYLPGNLKLKRRANEIYKKLKKQNRSVAKDPMVIMDWVTVWALAVNEENASGGRVVTAPTNGAAGIIPAVLHYYERFCPEHTPNGIHKFLLAAGAIGVLYKLNASISGAEVGCQGEVGVACSMAAAGLTEALGGTIEQVENAAEIGMEHNLGLTCDPVAGLVQIPCIERNAMAAVKAIDASRIALLGSGKHYVSLDVVMKTMRETGLDMKSKYKETSKGGLAVNITEC